MTAAQRVAAGDRTLDLYEESAYKSNTWPNIFNEKKDVYIHIVQTVRQLNQGLGFVSLSKVSSDDRDGT